MSFQRAPNNELGGAIPLGEISKMIGSWNYGREHIVAREVLPPILSLCASR